jgi:hypothetical protein
LIDKAIILDCESGHCASQAGIRSTDWADNRGAARHTAHLLAYLLLLTSCAKMETPTPETARTPEFDARWVANVTGPA